MAEPEELSPAAVKRGGRTLTIDEKALELKMLEPEILAAALQLGQAAINKAIIDTFIDRVVANTDPDLTLSPAPIFVVRFGTQSRENSILTPKGRDNGTSVHTELDELKEPYRPYWHAVSEGGFRPEVRSNFTGPVVGGIWLMLHRRKTGAKLRLKQKTYDI